MAGYGKMLNRPLSRHCAGFSLIELMVAMVAGLVLIGGALAVFTDTLRTNADNLAVTKLNQELRAVMDVMLSDVRRAGADLDAQTRPNKALNPVAAAEDKKDISPFMRATTTLRVLTYGGVPASCIMYSYDRFYDAPQNLPLSVWGATPPDSEVFGFRLNNGAVEMLTGGTTVTNNCDAGVWQALTNPNVVTINRLEFDTRGSQCRNLFLDPTDVGVIWTNPDGSTNNPCEQGSAGYVASADGQTLAETRQIYVLLDGQLASDGAVNKVVEGQVRVRNDRLCYRPNGMADMCGNP